MNVGDFIKLKTPQGLKTWVVTGIHLGALHQQGIVTVIPFVATSPDAYGKKVEEMQIPIEMIAAINSLQEHDK